MMNYQPDERSLPEIVDAALRHAEVLRYALIGKPCVPVLLPDALAPRFEQAADGRIHFKFAENPAVVQEVLAECQALMAEISQRGGPMQTMRMILGRDGVLTAIQTGNMDYTPLTRRGAGPRPSRV